jgi:transcriptional regulator with XRE-family HTH domain
MSIDFTKMDKTSSTKSVMLFAMGRSPQAFIDWLRNEMATRNLGVRETALKAGVSHPTISDIVTNGKQPTLETVKALARAFEKKDIWLLRLAGLIDQEPEYIPLLDEWTDVFYELTQEDQEELLEIARLKARKHKPPIGGDKLQKQTSGRGVHPARSALTE